MDFKRIPVNIDIATGKQINENGKVISRDSEYMRLIYSETCVICVTFYTVSYMDGYPVTTPYALPQDAFFQCMGDSDFDEQTSLMFYSGQTNDENNKVDITGDWFEGGSADRSLGQVSFRVNTRTSKFIEVLTTGKYSYPKAYCGISMIPAGETDHSVLASFRFMAVNRITSESSAPEPDDPDYYNRIEVDSLFTNYYTSVQVNNLLTGGTTIAHSHAISEVTDLQAALDAKESTANKGTANGYAELDGTGKVPAAQLPAYVDDVLEYADFASLPATGEAGKIYVTLDDNKTYRWSGSAYVEISSSLALGETESTAYRGDHGAIAYAHSQATSGNPHSVTKSDIGLGNADNTSDANKPVSTAQQTALDAKADGNHTHDFSLLYAGINHGHTISSITDLQNFYCDSGNIGINIHNPQEKLHIVGNARIDNTANDTYFRINSYLNSGNYNDASIIFSTPRSTSAEGANVTGRGIITAKGNGVDTASDLYIAAATASLTPETVSSAQMYIKVHAGGTAGGAMNHLSIGSGSDIFCVSGDGNVGIGTTSPSEKLEVNGNLKVTGLITGSVAIRDYSETTTTSGTYTPDYTDGDFQRITLSGDMTLNNPTTIPASGKALQVEVVTGSNTLTVGTGTYSDGVYLVNYYRSGATVRKAVLEVE